MLTKEMTVRLKQGIAKLDLVYETITDTGASFGNVHLTICQLCTFEVVYEGFAKIDGDMEQTRVLHFEHIPPQSAQRATFQIRPPSNAQRVELLFSYKCDTCAVEPRQHLFLNITGS